MYKEFQSVFLSRHNVETASVKISCDLLAAADLSFFFFFTFKLILLDLSAAFYNILHSILLDRLECIDIMGTALTWF